MITRAIVQFLVLQLAFSYSTDWPPPTAGPTQYPTAAPTAAPTNAPTNAPTTTPAGCPVGWVESTEGCFLFHHTGNIGNEEDDDIK